MAVKILLPSLSPTMTEGKLVRWLVKEGDVVAAGDLLAEVETDKAVMEVEAVDEGFIGKIFVPEGTEGVQVNAEIALLLLEDETLDEFEPTEMANDQEQHIETALEMPPSPPVSAQISAQPVAQKEKAQTARLFASPVARRLAAEKNIDLAQVTGRGPNGRIVKADIEELENTVGTNLSSKGHKAAPSATTSAIFSAGERVEISPLRKIIATRLTEAKQTIPHFYLRRAVCIDRLLKIRTEINQALAAQGKKISINDFVIKAVAMALQDKPEANAIWCGDHIKKFTHSDVAVAVSIEGGLVTPVLQGVERKSLSSLSEEMKALAGRAREKRLTPEEYQGGSITISNLGMYGVESFDAVINPPHSAILAVGAGVRQPVFAEDDTVASATMMGLSLSVDHRVVDGVLGAQLLGHIVDYLEAPVAMLLT